MDFLAGRVTVHVGDITAQQVDAIVNAADASLLGTGAYGYPSPEAARVVSQAIHAALADAPGIREVRLVFYSPGSLEEFLAHQVFPPD